MAAYVDQPQLRRLHRLSQRQSRITINVYAQLLLLLSIFLSVLLSMPTYAVTDSSTSENIVLNNEATEARACPQFKRLYLNRLKMAKFYQTSSNS